MKIAFIGAGSMSKAMMPRLVHAGHEVSAWNRSANALDDVTDVRRLDSPAHAFESKVVISMLSDDSAARSVLLEGNALVGAHEGTIHIVMSTLSPDMIQELQHAHADAGIGLIAAPVFGIPSVAAAGELNILAAGGDADLAQVQPIFDLLGKKTWHMGNEPVQACVAKIAGNMMITQAIQALSEATALTESYGLSGASFVDLITQTLFACPSYQRYGRNITTGSFEPGFALKLGLKDINLAISAAEAKGSTAPAAHVVKAMMEDAVARGLGDRDWSILSTTTTHAPH